MNYQVAVLGGGPGGYVAAIKAAQYGLKVALIEKDALGGTCLNRGCIPTKALIRSAEVFETVKNAQAYGLSVTGCAIDAKLVFARKDGIVRQLVAGVTGLMKANKIDVYSGVGRITGPRELTVRLPSGEERSLQAEKLILATGSKTFIPPIPGVDSPGVVTSDQALTLGYIPGSIAIIGGGVIGLEFAYLLNAFGCKVTVFEMLPDILPAADRDVVTVLVKSLTRAGVTFITGAKVEGIAGAAPRLTVAYRQTAAANKLDTELVLLAAGRVPNPEGTEPLGLSGKGGIPVNDRQETALAGIYAIGDVTGGIQLAHVASTQGLVAAANAAGHNESYDGSTVPLCIYTKPEAAWIGLSEIQARQRLENIKVGHFPFRANGKSLSYGESEGFVKVIADARYHEIVGLHIVGPHATDLISEGVLARKAEATAEELARAIHPHPTLSEALMEAAHACWGKAIHFA